MPRKKTARRKRGPSWKITQLDIKTRRRLRSFFLAIIVLISTAVVGLSIHFYNYLRSPLVSASDGSYAVSNGWDRDSRFNVLLVGEGEGGSTSFSEITYLSILSLDPQDKSALLLDIPKDLLINSAFIPIKQFTDKDNSSNLNQVNEISVAVSSALGVRFGGFVVIGKEESNNLSSSFEATSSKSVINELRSPLNWVRPSEISKIIKAVVSTNLRIIDYINGAVFFASVRPDKIITETAEADWFSSKAKLSEKMRSLFVEKRVVDEGQKIVVLNGTGETGLATKASVIINQLGGDVIEVTNTNGSVFPESVLVVRDLKDSYTKNRLINIFKVKEVREVDSFSGDPLYNILKRSDLSLILGLDRPNSL